MHIIPMRDLKDTVKLETLCNEVKEPVFVTKNGYGSLVVMDLDTFEKLLFKAYEAKAVNEALDSVEAGQVHDAASVMAELKKKYDI